MISNAGEKVSDTAVTHKLQGYKLNFWNNLPKANGWVNDWEGLLTKEQTGYLNRIIDSFKAKEGIEIAIITLDTACTTSETFMDLVTHIQEKWLNTQDFRNNGVLVCVSAGYSRIEIVKGEKVKKMLSSNEDIEIEEKGFVPHFRKAEYYDGILSGLYELMSILRMKNKNANSGGLGN
jgi:uncharacterized protein